MRAGLGQRIIPPTGWMAVRSLRLRGLTLVALKQLIRRLAKTGEARMSQLDTDVAQP